MRSHTVKTERPQAVKRNPVSPTAPTFVTLNYQLGKAHRRIRELEDRETELLSRNTALCALISELTDDDHAHTAAEVTPASNPDSDGLDIGDHLGHHTSQRLGPRPRSQTPTKNIVSAGASVTGTNRVKTRRPGHV